MSSPPPASDTLRTFIAVDLPGRVKDGLRDVQDRLRPKCSGARWVKPGNIHLTLKFLGNTRQEKISPVCDALGRAASRHAPFTVSIRGVGAFPNPGRPRVLWVGVGEGGEALRALAGTVEESLEKLGFPRERRPFSPHLTIARFKGPADLGGDVLEDAGDCGAFEAEEITFFQSILRPEGAEYIPLQRFELGG